MRFTTFRKFPKQTKPQFDGSPSVTTDSRLDIQQCPTCGEQAPRLLEASSRDAVVNYYRCPHCGTVWNKSKDADAPVRIVATYPPHSVDPTKSD
jgi:predicted RNA-binding Zn-ribbon protein involved in translation (DUF1610 family)